MLDLGKQASNSSATRLPGLLYLLNSILASQQWDIDRLVALATGGTGMELVQSDLGSQSVIAFLWKLAHPSSRNLYRLLITLLEAGDLCLSSADTGHAGQQSWRKDSPCSNEARVAMHPSLSRGTVVHLPQWL